LYQKSIVFQFKIEMHSMKRAPANLAKLANLVLTNEQRRPAPSMSDPAARSTKIAPPRKV
jgi:hypothetical protein